MNVNDEATGGGEGLFLGQVGELLERAKGAGTRRGKRERGEREGGGTRRGKRERGEREGGGRKEREGRGKRRRRKGREGGGRR